MTELTEFESWCVEFHYPEILEKIENFKRYKERMAEMKSAVVNEKAEADRD